MSETHRTHDSREPRFAGPGHDDLNFVDEVEAQVRAWLETAQTIPADSSAQQLADLLKDPDGLDFTVGFVDGVIRPEDSRVAARKLAELAPRAPKFLPWYMRGAVQAGGIVGRAGRPGAEVVVPAARKVLRDMVGHLIVDASEDKLGPAIKHLKEREGIRLNINLLGEAILGSGEAAHRLEGTRTLLARDDVDYVSIKVSSTVKPHNPWAFDEAVDHVVQSLTPLYRLAKESPTPKFINLDMEEYKDLGMTIEVFQRILDQAEFKDLEAGIVLQAYLPDALGAYMNLLEWSKKRRIGGGAPIKIRLVKGANLPMEIVEASLHDWPVATVSSKQDADTNYKRVLDHALKPENVKHVKIGVAGHNLFDVAFAWILAGRRGVRDGIDFEMLLGMASGQAEAVRRDVGGLLLYTPVVHPSEFDVAIAYLIRRLEEGASQENFMSAVFELDKNEELFQREKQRFVASLEALMANRDLVPGPARTQDQSKASNSLVSTDGFHNEPDTDPALPANRAWGRKILSRATGSKFGTDEVTQATISNEATIEKVLARGVELGKTWGALPAEERANVLDRVGQLITEHRAELLEVMASEAGKTLDQGDPEVSEAADFAHYYAERARELDSVPGAEFVPSNLTVVTPPWNFPVAIPAGSALSALAAGSAVIFKPAPQANRCGAVVVGLIRRALQEAGHDPDIARLVVLSDEQRLGERLIADSRVDRVILTGAFETAELFRSFRKDLPVLAETSGKNALIVTPSADLDLAVKDLVASAFGHAGQKCSAASLVILVGSVGKSERFQRQLVDAVSSLVVGLPRQATTQMGPVIEPAQGKLLDGLTKLGPGESWLVEPKKLDESGRLWTPGVRDNVKPGSEYHLTEYFGPILGIIRVKTLAEAVRVQNQVEYGLTAGLHSLNMDEQRYWVERVQAGNLYINRGITGAIVRRQPFGGWKRSAVGAGTKAGGPNYLIGLGSWKKSKYRGGQGRELTDGALEHGESTVQARVILDAARAVLGGEELGFVRQALANDASAWGTEFGVVKDVCGLVAEQNMFRYLPMPGVEIRYEDSASLGDLVRVLGAAATVGGELTVSSDVELPAALMAAAHSRGWKVNVESRHEWLTRASRRPKGVSGAGRVRLVAGSDAAARATIARELMEAVDGRPDVAVYAGEVVSAGRVELLPFLREQAVSRTAHRFGNPVPALVL
ncbi:bifunctional proline dehydrogenase/L-glutamate gamma-semialdehyde dehydrogenase [Falsarthrobacter nasiphocae]|uniref:L-glutamate gamma-semialdehyde dehydrogenase n=1 Tax=Falsarthrobacter nasiphocae TaxID=189863 RepID=A0AAE3YHB8_9MICC|nr:bifunctional proline dehydrogenase/L-glutamate gamma-semialdehyde dehydrogenase [Falsarthrobacter nasiphocae]MDR6892205.1 RHH-type proline utilization regulon transcriptional repressor/proline dehydrogenase/delta 1-pyrroline-5-carboxylate dehydrogenase [Falsarthrobacter nasiphocae]